ncbi:glutathione ABC transporter ATP-binding protein GsiA [Burkholderia sp. WAC0059]|uniref:ABC transporter ATP-binding protein n=1 Tax=Burkholderia sp. WAC0059 TaxID=2066022 RepID=UPI000C7E9B78|nr:ABC transporter ATP-binding protein [Burkholderia sp. WAC0059]PLZ02534.1 glutathione ABC transporter ATP-binding protein GsiA [Burkholderia sp. WAC0059]
MMKLLEVHDLRVRFGDHLAVRGVDFDIAEGETLALVGESGSGKSASALSLLQLVPEPGRVSGSVRFAGRELLGLAPREVRALRGREISMIFQEPMTSLNPVLTVGAQIVEVLRQHEPLSKAAAWARAVELLDLVRVPQPQQRVHSYAHELSGGQRQRVMIAMAVACRPRLLIADEPTTALDATIQARVLELLDTLKRELSMALLLITHDLGLVAAHADRVAVMLAGRKVEEASVGQLFGSPQHPYTRALLDASLNLDDELHYRSATLPEIRHHAGQTGDEPAFTVVPRRPREGALAQAEDRPAGTGPAIGLVPAAEAPDGVAYAAPASADTASANGPANPGGAADLAHGPVAVPSPVPVLDVQHLRVTYPQRGGGAPLHAVDDVSLQIGRGETLGLVGESGCGKSSLSRAILRLVAPSGGRILLHGTDLVPLAERELRPLRRHVQMVFQDPYASLNPRRTIGQILDTVLVVNGVSDRAQRTRRIATMLDRVGLPQAAARRFPHEFSGGQRQRIGIARALILEPDLVICDEPVSALDVSIQAQILNLLVELKEALGLSYLFISHDLSVVRYIADRVQVMQRGRIVETGAFPDLWRAPQHPYTRMLLDAIPGRGASARAA